MKQKIWFITGASSGLGQALAEAVIEKGDFVIGTFRDETKAIRFNAKHKDKTEAILLDLSNPEAISQQVQAVYLKYERIDVLVNNAGLGFVGSLEETSMKEARQVFEVNYFSMMLLTQQVLPIMRKQHAGHIVQISSHGGVKAFPGFGIYNASKFALEGYSEALAQEVKPLGIKVTIVEPGPFRTAFAGRNLLVAKKVIYDYAETAGAFKTKLQGVDGKQEGDPQKAAVAVIDHLQKQDATLRLPLGKIPMTTIRMKIDSLIEDLERNRAVAESAVFDQ